MAMTEALRGHHDEAARWLTSLDTIELDYHLVFHLGESYAVAGDTARGLDLVERAVQHGFHPPDFIARHDPFLEPLRSAPAFDRIVAEARKQSEAFEE